MPTPEVRNVDPSLIARAADWVATAERVVALTGAGVSAESGVPTFRGAGGFWRGRDPMELATPAAFARDPELVWSFYNDRRSKLATVEPNPAHRALVEIERRVPHFTLATQNVDRLHQRAGSRRVLELHGAIDEVRCSECGRTSNRAGETLPALPRCDACGGLLRPGVVWFGESLPTGVFEQAEAEARAADVVLVIGTSALVYPAASLARLGRRVVEVNPDATPLSGEATLSLRGKAGEIVPQLVPRTP